MIRKKDIIAGLEIARNEIRMAVCEMRNGEVLLYTSRTRCPEGIKNGAIVNLDNVTEAIINLAEETSQKIDKKIDSVFVNIGGVNIKTEIAHPVITLQQRGCEITQRHIKDLLDSCRIVSIPLDRCLLYLYPLEYIIDGQDGVKNPAGLCGNKLEAEVFIISAPVNQVQNITKAVNFAGLEVKEIVLTQIANSHSLLNSEERDRGALLIDLKTDMTEISVFRGEALLFFKNIPRGQGSITNEISSKFNLPLELAEEIKMRYAFLSAPQTQDPRSQEAVPLEWMGVSHNILRGEMNRIAAEQLELIFNLISEGLKDFKGFTNSVKRGAVLTGGAAHMEGLLEWAGSKLGFSVRQGLPSENREAGYAASSGLAEFGRKRLKESQAQNGRGGLNKLFQKAGEILGDYF